MFSVLEKIRAQQVLRDPRGDLLVNRVYSPDYAFGEWLIRLPANTRPETSAYADRILADQYLAGFAADEQTELTSRPRVAAVVFDGFMKESKVLDCGEGAAGPGPLTYDPNTGAACVHLAGANLSYLRATRTGLDAAGYGDRGMVGNLTQLGPAIAGMALLDAAIWEATRRAGQLRPRRDERAQIDVSGQAPGRGRQDRLVRRG